MKIAFMTGSGIGSGGTIRLLQSGRIVTPPTVRQWSASRLLFLRLLAVGEAGIAEAGADRDHAPVLGVLHERPLAQSLHDRVVVHEDRGLVLADGGDRLAQLGRQMESLAFPVP